MTLDYFSFCIGAISVVLASLMYIGIIKVMEEKERHKEWIRAQYGSSISLTRHSQETTSEKFWGEKIRDQSESTGEEI